MILYQEKQRHKCIELTQVGLTKTPGAVGDDIKILK